MTNYKYELKLNDKQVNDLIILLELAEREIHRNFKYFNAEDVDLKEIYWNYRYAGKTIRGRLRELRGY
jgi:hypothetical protein